MSSILVVVLLLVAVALWLTSIPLDIEFELDTQSKTLARIRLKWFYGIVKYTAKKPTKKSEHKKKKKTKPRKSSGKQTPGFASRVIQSEGFIARTIQLVLDCFRVLQIRNSHLFLRFGLDDPADTGMYMSVIMPAFSILQNGPLPNAQLEVDYQNAVFVLKGGSQVRVVPLKYLGAFLSYVFSKEFLRGMRSGVWATT